MTDRDHTPPIVRQPTQTPTYRSWASMWYRCLHKNATGYENYGGRGILVHLRWLDYQLFYADMGPRQEGTSLDRIDPNKGYCPGNCRWATTKVQLRNKRNTRYLTFNGVTKCLTDWEEHHGLPNGILRQRLNKGWAGDRLFQRSQQHMNGRASASKILLDATTVIAASQEFIPQTPKPVRTDSSAAM